MDISCRFEHYNFNVVDLEKSLEFYKKALGLTEKRRKNAADGSFIIVFLTDGNSAFELELTWLRDWSGAYDMGDNELHLAVTVPGDYNEIRKFHAENGWVCYENETMNLYFINDPDDHWIEVLPRNR
ncbi:lactoylglutathione lyase [Clostridia bacterium]|nr:lactoylglutathione lyase [Clostridia bacterium]